MPAPITATRNGRSAINAAYRMCNTPKRSRSLPSVSTFAVY
jgi:hypothetical protein